jgi:transposase
VNLRRESDIERVREVAQLALNEVDRLVAEMVRLRRENLELKGATPQQLQQELALLEQRFADDAARLEAEVDKRSAEAKEQQTKEKVAKKPRAHSGTRLEQKTLPVVEVVHDVDEADRKCRECGGDTTLWEGQDDVTEEVDVVTREFVIRKHIRRKYRCSCGCLESADMSKRLVPGGRYSNEFAVEVATMKYVDQLPLERIVKIFKREGLVIDSQTLWDQVHALANVLKPTWRRLREEILSSSVIGMDQSPWKVLGHDKTWQMWTLTTTKLCWFDICETKGTADGVRVLGSFKGTVIGDAATTHDALAKSLPITLAHCWAHVLRAAEQAEVAHPIQAAKILGFIRKLYDVDDEAGDDIEKRRTLRDTKSRALVGELYEWRLAQHPLPSSPLAKLLGYIDRHKVGLTKFLDDVHVPLDNNQSERGYGWVAVGRRSYFGSRSKRGTEAAAIFYSLAESARRCGVEPRAWFSSALAAALDSLAVKLPHEL